MTLPAANLRKSIEEKLEGRPGFRKALGNLGWLFSDRLLRLGLGLLVSCWMTRMLGPSQYGLLNWASAWVGFFSVLAVLGLDSIVVRDIVRFPEDTNSILGTAFVMKGVGGILALMVSVGLVAAVHPHLGTGERLLELIVGLYAASTIFQAFDTIDFWFQSQIASRFVVYGKTTVFLVMAATRLWLIHRHAPAVAFAAAGFVETILGAAGLWVTYASNRHSIREWSFDIRWMRTLLADSWPVMLTGIAITFQARVDQVMLGMMVGRAEVGQFAAAMGMIESFSFIPMAINSTAAPIIVKAKERGEQFYYSRLCDLYRLMFLAFLAVAVPLMFLAKPIVVLLLGRKFTEAGTLLALMGIRLFFTNFGVARSVFIMSANLFRYTLATAIVGSVVNFAMNYWLIPHYHAVGSIWSMIVSYFVMTFLMDAFYPPVRRNLREMLRALATPWRLSFA